MCSTGSSCGQQGTKWVLTLIILLECQTVVAKYALFNASHSTLYISSSVEACPLWKCCYYCFIICYIIIYYCHYYRDKWFSFTIMLYHKILELFYLWCPSNLKLQENCAINAQTAIHLKTAVIVTFLAWSLALHRTAEPQEALWQQKEGLSGTKHFYWVPSLPSNDRPPAVQSSSQILIHNAICSLTPLTMLETINFIC